MKLIKRFYARNGNERRVYRESPSTLIIEGTSRYMRGGGTRDGGLFIDWEGGPFLATGDTIRNTFGMRSDRTIERFEPMLDTPPDQPDLRRYRLHLSKP